MNSGKELIVGLVIILAIATGVFGTLWLQGTNFGRPQIPIDVLLESVGQLQEGNAVTYRGVRVGRVEAINVEPGAQAVRLALLIDDVMELPDSAGVILAPEGVFGDWQAEIVEITRFPGFPFFEVPEGPHPVPLIGGYSLPELSRLTASAEQIATNLREITARLELTFNQETADNLSNAIANIEAITAEVRTLVQQQGLVAASITANADSALVEVEGAAQAARLTFEGLEGQLSGPRMDSILTNMNLASSGLRDLTAQLADSTGGLPSTLTQVDSAFARIDRLAARVEAGEGTLGRLMSDSTLAIRAEDVLFQLELLLRDVRENPRRYVRLSIF